MPDALDDLHGSAPDSCCVVLLLVDVINDLEFDGGEDLYRHFEPVAERLAGLKRRCREAGVPVVYVNDNFGRWKSDFQAVVEHCCDEGVRGGRLSSMLRPGEEDYFVLKPKHSGFFHTSLELLLEHLGAKTLIITGVAGNNCVLFTANDAYLRDYRVVAPSDGLASESKKDSERALHQMRHVLKASTPSVEQLDLRRLVQEWVEE